MEEDARIAALSQWREEKARASAIARERAREKKRAAAARGYALKPVYEFDPRLRRFVEKTPKSTANSIALEINHEVYTWPELAGEFSGPAMRRAGEVWRAAKDYYGLSDEEAEKWARRRVLIDGRYLNWDEFLQRELSAGRSEIIARDRWKSLGLRAPRAPRSRPNPIDESARVREIADSTGLIGYRPPPKGRAPKPTKRGDFQSPLYTPAPTSARLVSAPVRGQVHFAAEPEHVYFASEPGEKGLASLPKTKGARKPPAVSSRSPFGAWRVETEHLPEEVSETRISRISSPKSYVTTPLFASTAVGSPYASASASPRYTPEASQPELNIRNRQVDEAMDSSLPVLKRNALVGAWRFSEGGIVPPWRGLVVSNSATDYAGSAISADDDHLLTQLYFGGWAPRSISDYFAAKVGGGKIRLEKNTGRPAPTAFLTFVEAFWSRYKEATSSLKASAQISLPKAPASTRTSLPDWVVDRLAGRNRTVPVLTPQFWEQPLDTRETRGAYLIRLARDGRTMADEWISSLRQARGV